MDLASHLRSAAWHVGRAAMMAHPDSKAPYAAMARELAADVLRGGGDPDDAAAEAQGTTPFLRALLLDPAPGAGAWDPDTHQIKTERVFASMVALERQLRGTPGAGAQWSTLVDALALSHAHQEDLAAQLRVLRSADTR